MKDEIYVTSTCQLQFPFEIHSRRNVLDDATEDGMIEKDDLRLSSPPTIIDIVSSPTCHMSGISSLLASFACSAGRARKKRRAGGGARPALSPLSTTTKEILIFQTLLILQHCNPTQVNTLRYPKYYHSLPSTILVRIGPLIF